MRTVREMLTIDGNSDETKLAASEFANEVIVKSQACFDCVSRVRYMEVWLTESTLREAKDSIATSCQIVASVFEVSKFHENKSLNNVFGNLYKEVNAKRKATEELYKQFVDLYPV